MSNSAAMPGGVPDDETSGPVPADNQPGHHPDVEQDKPIGRRPRPRVRVQPQDRNDGGASARLADTRDDNQTDGAGSDDAGSREDAESAGETDVERFEFEFSGPAGIAARAFTLSEDRAYVEVGDGTLTARYGPWRVETPLHNIAEVSLTGPFKVWKVAGPPHISMADKGITFATNAASGVCIRFHEPVTGIEPTGRVRHPGLTVTVADTNGLMAALAAH